MARSSERRLHDDRAPFDFAQGEEKILVASKKFLTLSEVEGRTIDVQPKHRAQ
jgi:hypothetical protein